MMSKGSRMTMSKGSGGTTSMSTFGGYPAPSSGSSFPSNSIEVNGTRYILQKIARRRTRYNVLFNGDYVIVSLPSSEKPALAQVMGNIKAPSVTPFYEPTRLLGQQVSLKLFEEKDGVWRVLRQLSLPMHRIVAFAGIFRPYDRDIDAHGVILAPQSQIEFASVVQETDIGLQANPWDKVKGVLPAKLRRRLHNLGGTEERPLAKHYALSTDVEGLEGYSGTTPEDEASLFFRYLQDVRQLAAILRGDDETPLSTKLQAICQEYANLRSLPTHGMSLARVAAEAGPAAVTSLQTVLGEAFRGLVGYPKPMNVLRSVFHEPMHQQQVLQMAKPLAEAGADEQVVKKMIELEKTLLLGVLSRKTNPNVTSAARASVGGGGRAFFGSESFDPVTLSYMRTVRSALNRGNMGYIRAVIDTARKSHPTGAVAEFGKLAKVSCALPDTFTPTASGEVRLDFEATESMVAKISHQAGRVTTLHFAAANTQSAILKTFIGLIRDPSNVESLIEGPETPLVTSCGVPNDDPTNFHLLLNLFPMKPNQQLEQCAARAAVRGNIRILREVVREWEELNVPNTDKTFFNTALRLAVLAPRNAKECLTVLSGANCPFTSDGVAMAFRTAAEHNRLELLAHIGVEMRGPLYSCNVIEEAISHRSFAAVQWLFMRGFDLGRITNALSVINNVVGTATPSFVRWFLNNLFSFSPEHVDHLSMPIVECLTRGDTFMLRTLLELAEQHGKPISILEAFCHRLQGRPFAREQLDNLKICLKELGADPNRRGIQGRMLIHTLSHIQLPQMGPEELLNQMEAEGNADDLIKLRKEDPVQADIQLWDMIINKLEALWAELEQILDESNTNLHGYAPYELDASIPPPLYNHNNRELRPHIVPSAFEGNLGFITMKLLLRKDVQQALVAVVRTQRTRLAAGWKEVGIQANRVVDREAEVVQIFNHLITKLTDGRLGSDPSWVHSREVIMATFTSFLENVAAPLGFLEQSVNGRPFVFTFMAKTQHQSEADLRRRDSEVLLQEVIDCECKRVSIMRAVIQACDLKVTEKEPEKRVSATSDEKQEDTEEQFYEVINQANDEKDTVEEEEEDAPYRFLDNNIIHQLVLCRLGSSTNTVLKWILDWASTHSVNPTLWFNTPNACGHTPMTLNMGAEAVSLYRIAHVYGIPVSLVEGIEKNPAVSLVHGLLIKGLAENALELLTEAPEDVQRQLMLHCPGKHAEDVGHLASIVSRLPGLSQSLSVLMEHMQSVSVLDQCLRLATKDGLTPMMEWLLANTGGDIPELMLAHSDPGQQDKLSRTAFHYLFAGRHTGKVEADAFRGSSIQPSDPAIHTSSLVSSITSPDVLQHKDMFGHTALSYAAMANAMVSAQVLLGAGAQPSLALSDARGNTPLAHAIIRQRGPCASLLLQQGAPPDTIVFPIPADDLTDMEWADPEKELASTVFGAALDGDATCQGISLLLSLNPKADRRLYAAEAIRHASSAGSAFLGRLILDKPSASLLGPIEFAGYNSQRLVHLVAGHWKDLGTKAAPLLTCLKDMGADFTAADGAGNTMMHYFAAHHGTTKTMPTDLSALVEIIGEEEATRQAGAVSALGHTPLSLTILSSNNANPLFHHYSISNIPGQTQMTAFGSARGLSRGFGQTMGPGSGNRPPMQARFGGFGASKAPSMAPSMGRSGLFAKAPRAAFGGKAPRRALASKAARKSAFGSFGRSLSPAVESSVAGSTTGLPAWYLKAGSSHPAPFRLEKGEKTIMTSLATNHFAISFIKALLAEVDADVLPALLSGQASDGTTPLLAAAKLTDKRPKMLEALLSRGAKGINPNVADSQGRTAIHYLCEPAAVSEESLAELELVWKHRAELTEHPDFLLEDKTGRSPLQLAQVHNGPILEWMLKKTPQLIEAMLPLPEETPLPDPDPLRARLMSSYASALSREIALMEEEKKKKKAEEEQAKKEGKTAPSKAPMRGFGSRFNHAETALTEDDIMYDVSGLRVIMASEALSSIIVMRTHLKLIPHRNMFKINKQTVVSGFNNFNFGQPMNTKIPNWRSTFFSDNLKGSGLTHAKKSWCKQFRRIFGYDWGKVCHNLDEVCANPMENKSTLLSTHGWRIVEQQKLEIAKGRLQTSLNTVINRASNCCQQDINDPRTELPPRLVRMAKYYGSPISEQSDMQVSAASVLLTNMGRVSVPVMRRWGGNASGSINIQQLEPEALEAAEQVLEEMRPLCDRAEACLKVLTAAREVEQAKEQREMEARYARMEAGSETDDSDEGSDEMMEEEEEEEDEERIHTPLADRADESMDGSASMSIEEARSELRSLTPLLSIKSQAVYMRLPSSQMYRSCRPLIIMTPSQLNSTATAIRGLKIDAENFQVAIGAIEAMKDAEHPDHAFFTDLYMKALGVELEAVRREGGTPEETKEFQNICPNPNLSLYRVRSYADQCKAAPPSGSEPRLYWHGTRDMSAVGSILHRGMKIIPNPSTYMGALFGQGIYLSPSDSCTSYRNIVGLAVYPGREHVIDVSNPRDLTPEERPENTDFVLVNTSQQNNHYFGRHQPAKDKPTLYLPGGVRVDRKVKKPLLAVAFSENQVHLRYVTLQQCSGRTVRRKMF
eukprot:gnl/Dysnectes_brevis/1306_a1462_1913.p1 GENE.gnl/Dysnectes_brevis/1306_a1462_1913~~gnl/Dysnectes_brevis/1306_a1462_1913.p1  ORF type:complete len:2637 (+),score=908.57 gnl/Dysnectes_brevis/1306_a1462_1913:145-7911(+)